jgi:hypothetical protein
LGDTARLRLTETVVDLDVLVNDRIDRPVEADDGADLYLSDDQSTGCLRCTWMDN